jgi:ketosteroid isomerase-like protein
MSSNKALIESFYSAFKNKDFKAMAECYHDDVYFRDEAFELKGKRVGAMWHMLCERGADMVLSYSVTEQDGIVTAHWEPKYSFSQTGRFVHNIIDAEFEFKEGKIIRHIDYFDFWRWSRQSLGMPGLLLGWSSFLKNKVSTMANKALEGFVNKHPEYEG